MRVLVCGSRTWGVNDDYTDPEAGRIRAQHQRNLLDSVLSGVYAEYEVGHLVAYMADFTLIEGGAKGADACASWWADISPFHSHNERPDDPKFTHLKFPADWSHHGRSAGPIRNQVMLLEGAPELCLAFIDKPLNESRGTRDMVERCQKAGVRTYVIQEVS